MASADRMGKLPNEIVREVSLALEAGGELIAAEMHVSITNGSASGHSGGKHQHVPSRPGEPPNNEWGDLVRSIEVVPVSPLRVDVQVSAPHAVPLEWGTSKMAARPFARPARLAKEREVRELVRKAVNRALRKTFGR